MLTTAHGSYIGTSIELSDSLHNETPEKQGTLENIHPSLVLKIGLICPGGLRVARALRQGLGQDDLWRPLQALGFHDSMTWPAVWSGGMKVSPVESNGRAVSSLLKTE